MGKECGNHPVIAIIQREFEFARDGNGERYISELLGNVLATRIAYEVGMFHVEHEVADWKERWDAGHKGFTEEHVKRHYVSKEVYENLQEASEALEDVIKSLDGRIENLRAIKDQQPDIEALNERIEALKKSRSWTQKAYKAYRDGVIEAISVAMTYPGSKTRLCVLLKALSEI